MAAYPPTTRYRTSCFAKRRSKSLKSEFIRVAFLHLPRFHDKLPGGLPDDATAGFLPESDVLRSHFVQVCTFRPVPIGPGMGGWGCSLHGSSDSKGFAVFWQRRRHEGDSVLISSFLRATPQWRRPCFLPLNREASRERRGIFRRLRCGPRCRRRIPTTSPATCLRSLS